ncbi:MAG: hypothetical protein HY897_02905 [Deltaproteobacteria bacterium]|nr:hypothetical protein [Deltaproteobacteria bacterium]
MRRVTLEIGGMAVGIEYDLESYGAVLRDKYGGYFSENAPGFSIKARVVPGFKTGCPNLPDPAVRRPDGAYDLLWYDLKGVFDPAARTATVTVSDSELSVNSVMRMLYSFYVRPMHGLLLHAASFVRNGDAYVFPGVSTAGKTTLSELTLASRPECELLTDEISIVRLLGGRWTAFGTPFWGNLRIGGRNVSAPVHRICFIEKAAGHEVATIDRREAFRRLMQNALFLVKDRVSAQETMDLAVEIAAAVDSCVLQFRKDAGFWEII